jgi:hypothetical protein
MQRQVSASSVLPRIAALICAWLLALNVLIPSAHAQTMRIVEYDYDAAGNIIAIRSARNFASPVVSSLSPAFINQDATIIVLVSGQDLGFSDVTTSVPGLTIVNVIELSEQSLQLIISSAGGTPIGAAPLLFTTALGSTSADLAVVTRLPIVATLPNPIALAPDGIARAVTLTFDQPFPGAQVYDISMGNPATASVGVTQATLPAGAIELTLMLTGHADGATTLDVQQLASFFAISLPVLVTSNAGLPPGLQQIGALAVGVRISLAPESFAGVADAVSAPVGVKASITPVAPPTNQLAVAPGVGVAVSAPPVAPPTNQLSVAPGVGVAVSAPPVAPPTNQLSVSPGVGVAVSAPPVAPPTNQLSVAPGVGVAVSAPPVAPPTNQLSVAPGVGVALSPPPVAPPADQLALAVPAPGVVYGLGVSTVTPSAVTPGTSVSLVLSGGDLNTVSAVSFNGTGINVSGALSVTPDGRQLTVPITVDPGLANSTRHITLTTPGGAAVFNTAVVNVSN